MSFHANFEKIAKTKDMSDIELALKADKHLHGAIKHDMSPYKGLAVGGAAGAVGAAAENALRSKKKGHGRLAALTAVGSLAGGATGLAARSWNQSHLRRESEELASRGIYAVPRGDKVYWQKRKNK